MTAAASPFIRLRWWAVVGLVFAGQLGVIFWLSRTGPPRLVAPRATPFGLSLVTQTPNPWFALTDPTVFALPHRHGFSGPAWMRSASLPLTNFVWSEPARPLDLPLHALDLVPQETKGTKPFSLVDAIAQTTVEPWWPPATPDVALPRHSTWRLTGQLASRRLLTPFALPSWTSGDLLTNSVVRLVVDAHGWPVSADLVPPGSGSNEADQDALKLATQARFEPLPASRQTSTASPTAGLSWGDLVFEWHTVPAAAPAPK